MQYSYKKEYRLHPTGRGHGKLTIFTSAEIAFDLHTFQLGMGMELTTLPWFNPKLVSTRRVKTWRDFLVFPNVYTFLLGSLHVCLTLLYFEFPLI